MTFRASMNWLHTWAGVVLGGLLFAIFWMGTLSVFAHEIDRWMVPASRLAAPEESASLEWLRPYVDQAASAGSPYLFAVLPTERQPVVRIVWRGVSGLEKRFLDPATTAALAEPGTLAGTGFIYPFHYTLHIRFARIGNWLVAIASMAMLLLCISGVVAHRRVLADFFIFRTHRARRRSILDLHNLAGILGLPFHLAITLSGLIIFFATYFPAGWQILYGDQRAFFNDALNIYARPRLGAPAELASLDTMSKEARLLWHGKAPATVFISHPGDAAAYVEIGASNEDRLTHLANAVYFDGATGAVLHRRDGALPILTAERFILGLHVIQVRHWTLRWLYFGLGLAGCVLIATGYLFWIDSRSRRHDQPGTRLVRGLAVGSVTGIIAATLAFFIANRVLPSGAMAFGQDRASLEVWIFGLVWLGCFLHAWLRQRPAWREQCLVIGAMAVTAVALNWATTGDHFGRSLLYRSLWPVAGIDLLLMLTAFVALRTGAKKAPGS